MIEQIIKDHLNACEELINQEKLIHEIATTCYDIVKKGRTIFICGNGGSAADSSHIAAEMVGKFSKKRRALSAISLTENNANLTSIGNDYGFEYIFSRQIEGLAKKGDLLLALSTSGNSKNIIKAINTASKMNMSTIGMTGLDGGLMNEQSCDYLLKVNSNDTARIQEMHLLTCHIICQYIDNNFK